MSSSPERRSPLGVPTIAVKKRIAQMVKVTVI
jgi:hypothetical protein